MIYLETGSTDPFYNLAFEEYVFESMNQQEDYFLLWQNKNAIIIGKHQNALEEINLPFTEERQIKIVRRNSGGGAVYHDMGNLNFSFITSKIANYMDLSFFTQPVMRCLEKLGAHPEFSGRNDITIEGKKISGNAQFIKNGRVLHHGTILLHSELSVVSEALSRGKKMIQSGSVKSVKSRVANISDYLEQDISVELFKEYLKSEIMLEKKLVQGSLTDRNKKEIQELCENKYHSWEWNYGSTPKFNLRKEKRFSAGTVCVYLISDKGRIKDISFRGDFFTYNDITDLEQELINAPIGQGLEAWLQDIQAGNYINGISEDDLLHLILDE